MKTSKSYFRILILGIFISAVSPDSFAQDSIKSRVAVLGIDSKGMDYNSESIEYLLRLELEKVNIYTVMDRYDVKEIMENNNLDQSTCLGSSCVVAAGKALMADKIITGYVERFGEKIVISLKLIDIKTESVEKQDATEYLNFQEEVQKMVAISAQKLLGINPDKDIVSVLINYEAPIKSPKTKATYSGPRMGAHIMFGDAAKVFTAPASEGGFNMYPVMFNFGWQQEIQYLSSGKFSALVEILPMIGGLESGKFVPTVSLLNGFRMGKGRWEIAFGPSMKIVKRAWGYFDSNNNWIILPGYSLHDYSTDYPGDVIKRVDSRGRNGFSTSLLLSFGKTFKSGYLNIPVNVYASLRREGTIVGFSCGFNITKQYKNKKEKEAKKQRQKVSAFPGIF